MPLLGAASLPARPAALCWFADETGAAGTSRLLVACDGLAITTVEGLGSSAAGFSAGFSVGFSASSDGS